MKRLTVALWLVLVVEWYWVPSWVLAEGNKSISLPLKALANASLDLRHSLIDGDKQVEDVRYRLFLPRPFDKRRTYPLILWIHGWGDRGDDNATQLKHMDTTLFLDGEDQRPPCFVLAPQCSRVNAFDWTTPLVTDSSGVNDSAAVNDMIAVTMELLDLVQQQYPIDRRRIVIVGISSGGTACWAMGMRYPDRFAAIAPLASGGGDVSRASALAGIPIWTFHNTYDDGTHVEGVREMVQAVEKAGGNVKLTEMPRSGHGAWKPAFQEHGLLEWLLERRQGEPSWKPFLRFVDWRLVALEMGIPFAIGLACWFEIRRRKLARFGATDAAATRSYSDSKLPDFSELIGDKA